MDAALLTILRESDGRYLNSKERSQLLAFASELPARIGASEEVETHEREIVDCIIGALRTRYPRFENLLPRAWDGFAVDLRMVLRADVRALIRGEVAELDECALFYLRSILIAYNVTPEFARDAFLTLKEACNEHLSPEASGLLEPYLNRNIEVLGEIPEPAVAMV